VNSGQWTVASEQSKNPVGRWFQLTTGQLITNHLTNNLWRKFNSGHTDLNRKSADPNGV